MESRAYTSEAVVLARKNYGEADRILVVFSKNQGKISLIAKGVRKPSSRKRGGIEIFNHIKFQAVRGKGLDLVTEVEVVDSFKEIRDNLEKVSVAYYFAEVIGRVTHENEPHLEIFYLLLDCLEELKKGIKLKTLRTKFAYELLITLGFWPKGQALPNPDAKLEEIIERNLSTLRVGKKLIS